MGVSGALGVFGLVVGLALLGNAFLTVEFVDGLPDWLQRRVLDYVAKAPDWRRPRDLLVVNGRLSK